MASPVPQDEGGENGVEKVICLLNTALKDDGLEVRRLADASKGLFATKKFEQGGVIWEEPPLLVAHTFSCPVSACRHCLRALRDGWGIECPGSCGHWYCGELCRGKARAWYHHAVCSCSAAEPARGERLREFEDFAQEAGNEYYVMAATGVASAIASLMDTLENEEEGGDEDEGDLDARLAEQVRCWFRQFEQRPWWQTLSNSFHASTLMTEAETAARAGNFELTSADRRKVFEMDVEAQTREAFALFICTLPARLQARLKATPQHLHRAYASLIGAIRMNSQHIAAPNTHKLSASPQGWQLQEASTARANQVVRSSADGHAGGECQPSGEEPGGSGDEDRQSSGHSCVVGTAAGAECRASDDDDFVSGIALFRIHSCINHRCVRGVSAEVGRGSGIVTGLRLDHCFY